MDNQFENDILKQAVKRMREEQNNETLLKASQALLDTKVLAPAKWDIEPEKAENGDLHFKPETKISLMVVQGNDGSRFFPMFTGMEEVKNFYGDNKVNCLILTAEQFIPFLQAAKEDIKGIVINPATEDVPFPTDFIEGIHKAYKKPLNQNTIRKGERVYIRNAEGDLQEIEAALISACFHEPAIQAAYLKERVDDPEKPETAHWFIVIDSEELDTGIFARLGEALKPYAQKKELEFIFTNQKLGKDLAASSKPLYVKALH